MHDPAVVDIADVHRPPVGLVGTKAWLLARVGELGFNVPDGFVLTTELYRRAVSAGRIERQLDEIWVAAADGSPERIQELARTALRLISGLRLDLDSARDVAQRIASFEVDTPLAVRSSLPSDAISGPECRGVHASFVNVVGSDHILSQVRKCWASLYGAPALGMRARGLGRSQPTMAVLIQPMVAAVKSGIASPLHGGSSVLVDATFGLSEPITTGTVDPDTYVVDTGSLSIRSKTIAQKQIVLSAGATSSHSFTPADQEFRQVLDDAECAAVTRLCTDIGKALDGPHEVEWAFGSAGPVVLQVRPIDIGHEATAGDAPSTAARAGRAAPVDTLVTGLGIGLGRATGPVRIILDDESLARVRDGDVVVATDTAPHWRPRLLRAAAIVTDAGDEHAHQARVAREYGIPAVVSAVSATVDLPEGRLVTVDAERGSVALASDDAWQEVNS